MERYVVGRIHSPGREKPALRDFTRFGVIRIVAGWIHHPEVTSRKAPSRIIYRRQLWAPRWN
jgi:hypothetical protein